MKPLSSCLSLPAARGKGHTGKACGESDASQLRVPVQPHLRRRVGGRQVREWKGKGGLKMNPTIRKAGTSAVTDRKQRRQKPRTVCGTTGEETSQGVGWRHPRREAVAGP